MHEQLINKTPSVTWSVLNTDLLPSSATKSLQGNLICNDFLFKPSQLIEIAELMAKEHSPSRKNIYEVILLTQPFLILVVTSDVSGCGQNGQPVLRERVLSWHRTVLQLIQEAIAANWRHNHLLKSLSLVCPILLSLR